MTALPGMAVSLEDAAALLDGSADYRVLRRFVPRARYNEELWDLGDTARVRTALYIDCETTGLDREHDEIIELGAVPFTYDADSGELYEVKSTLQFFEEPTRPISDEITALTGITLDTVRGQRIADAEIVAAVEGSDLVIAHNAEYDRPVLERRLPIFAERYWACSQQDIAWKRLGFRRSQLETLLQQTAGEFYDAHRATDDCFAGIHVLSARLEDERTAMAHLLDSARTPTIRLFAIDSPFDKKEMLKARRGDVRYRWSDGSKDRKGWFCDVKPGALEAEIEWLLVEIFSGKVDRRHAIATRSMTARDRYSVRGGA